MEEALSCQSEKLDRLFSDGRKQRSNSVVSGAYPNTLSLAANNIVSPRNAQRSIYKDSRRQVETEMRTDKPVKHSQFGIAPYKEQDTIMGQTFNRYHFGAGLAPSPRRLPDASHSTYKSFFSHKAIEPQSFREPKLLPRKRLDQYGPLGCF